MRSKNILSIVAFVAAFGLSVALASLFISKDTYNYNSTNYCKFKRNATAAAISTLIAEDNANGRARTEKIYDIGENFPPDVDSVIFADYAEATESYVEASSSIATNDLPRDFQAAWREHLKAWRDYSNFLNQSAAISNQSACSVRRFVEADSLHGQEINRTYSEALQIGRSYGANVR
ncbi:MAG: hypothetical protein LH472_14520 [Pyrinomonadaceae bacterium]|nr:hypothetical protein [Pyrinomonadaceae bacterium]